MNKLVRLFIFCSLILIFFFPNGSAYAKDHKLERIYIHTFIHEDGSATITETRKAYLTEGTENYIIIGNLGKSEITNFTVEENGKTYEFIEDWDISATQKEKAFKNGIVETDSTYELCWGIGEYGAHEYVVQYTVTNFIKQLDDAQILFWRYINDQTNIPPENVEIVIETDRPLTDKTENIWGFGFEGEIDFVEDKIIALNNEPFNENNYATVLVQFPERSFQTDDILNESFEEIFERAKVGSDYDDSAGVPFGVIILIIVIVVVPFMIIGFISFAKSMKRKKERNEILREIKGMYNRDFPFQHEFLDLFYMLKYIGLSQEKNIFTSIFLNWMYYDKVSTITEEKQGIFSTKNIISLKFNNEEDDREQQVEEDLTLITENELDEHAELDVVSIETSEHSIAATLDERLYKIMHKMADKENVLTPDRIRTASVTNKKRIMKWEESLTKNSLKFLIKEKYFEKKSYKSFSGNTIYEMTDKGKELQKEIYKFVQYLEDFSLVQEHEPINVKIWDRILIWAAALNMTDIVLKQLKDLYPNYEAETVYPIDAIAQLHVYSAIVHQYSVGASRSSGSGGFTSGGGGGGSFGGGSGGGTR